LPTSPPFPSHPPPFSLLRAPFRNFPVLPGSTPRRSCPPQQLFLSTGHDTTSIVTTSATFPFNRARCNLHRDHLRNFPSQPGTMQPPSLPPPQLSLSTGHATTPNVKASFNVPFDQARDLLQRDSPPPFPTLPGTIRHPSSPLPPH